MREGQMPDEEERPVAVVKTRRVKRSYHRELTRIGEVVDLSVDEARILVQEGRAVYVEDDIPLTTEAAYDSGGDLPPGLTLARNDTGAPIRLTTVDEADRAVGYPPSKPKRGAKADDPTG